MELTTTSYAILGLLSLRDWTTYELAKQMRRTLDYVWPRGERKLYDEPKRLVEVGFARARQDAVGNRPRTIYSITPAGRRALKRWLGTDPAPPVLEFEGMLRVLFGDQGDLNQLRHSIERIAEQAQSSREHLAMMAEEIVASAGGEFRQRVHVNALGMRFMVGHYDQILSWTRWALKETDGWADARRPAFTWAKQARAVMAEAARPGVMRVDV